MTYRRVLAVALIGTLATSSAYAKGANDSRTCDRYREEHPGFLGAFAVTAHKAAWNGGGFDDETRDFTCPALPGGEGLPAMRIEKIPSHHRRS